MTTQKGLWSNHESLLGLCLEKSPPEKGAASAIALATALSCLVVCSVLRAEHKLPAVVLKSFEKVDCRGVSAETLI